MDPIVIQDQALMKEPIVEASPSLCEKDTPIAKSPQSKQFTWILTKNTLPK